MQYIALDLWNKRVWIAHTKEGIVLPLAIIPRLEIIWYLKKYFQDFPESTIVVGLPYDLYGRDTKQLDKTQKFIEKLQQIFPKQDIIGHDERFSSIASEFDAPGAHRDDIAAMYILQSYLESKK